MNFNFRIIAILLTLFNIQCLGFLEQEKDNNREIFALLAFAAFVQNQGPNCNSNQGIWVRNIQTNTSDCIGAELVAQGSNVNFYKETGLNVNLNFAQLVVDFETKIHPNLVSAFGEPSDINGDGKIDIFILDIRDGSSPGNPFVAGFFDPVDFFNDNPNSPLRSNQREILYLDGKELVAILPEDPLAFGSTIAHEYQHLIRFPRMQRAGTQDNTWINEGTSEVASDIGGFGPQAHRIRCLRGQNSSPCVGGGNNVSLLAWNSGPANDPNYILKQYGLAYSFMRYLYDNAGSDTASKNQFFQNTVNGNSSGLRANQILNLMTLFRQATGNTSSLNYPDNILGQDSSESFVILLNRFWAQVIQGSDTTNITRSNSFPSPWNLGAPGNHFPLPTTLSNLPTNQFPLLSNIPSSVRSGSAIFVSGNLSTNIAAITGTNRVTSIPNGGNSVVVFADSNPNSSLTTSSSQFMSWNDWSKMHNHSSDLSRSGNNQGLDNGNQPLTAIPMCGNPFLEEIHEKK
ncbi:MAG: peptidase MA family protein [Leptospira sp.]|nr:peptidase MA family protein [Leptospira sp.]